MLIWTDGLLATLSGPSEWSARKANPARNGLDVHETNETRPAAANVSVAAH